MALALIVAAGRGRRMKEAIPKQYVRIDGCPIIGHTLKIFDACDMIRHIYLVVPENDLDYCREKILPSLKLKKRVFCVAGGRERQESVLNGLNAMEDPKNDDIVVIHDGVRPLVRCEHINACIDASRRWGACILGNPVFDTLKSVDSSHFIRGTVERSGVWTAQTPQAFRYDLIRNAHEQARIAGYKATDDASLLERLGEKVKMISGSRLNIKITTREDLKFANIFLQSKQTS